MHGYAFPRRSSRAQVAMSKNKFPASRLAPLGSGRPAYWRLFMPRFAERNTNCVKMQTDREIPAATKNHPYGVKSFPQLFSPEITDETARKPARIMRRGFHRRRVHARAQTASARVGASCTHTRAASRAASSRHATTSHARPASRQAVKPMSPRQDFPPRHGRPPPLRHPRALCAQRPARHATHEARHAPRIMRTPASTHYARTQASAGPPSSEPSADNEQAALASALQVRCIRAVSHGVRHGGEGMLGTGFLRTE